jgi:hypothetical protein
MGIFQLDHGAFSRHELLMGGIFPRSEFGKLPADNLRPDAYRGYAL